MIKNKFMKEKDKYQNSSDTSRNPDIDLNVGIKNTGHITQEEANIEMP